MLPMDTSAAPAACRLFLAGPVGRLAVLGLLTWLAACHTTQPAAALAYPAPAKGAGESRTLFFAKVAQRDSVPATLEVIVEELESHQPVQGATVVLQRKNSDLQYGQLTVSDGHCRFSMPAETYSARIQFTGLTTFFQHNLLLKPGGVYRLQVGMAPSGSGVEASLPLKRNMSKKTPSKPGKQGP